LERDPEVLIVGAGPAGLAVGACLAKRGLPARIVERGSAPGWSWVGRYASLRLHTPRGLSGLPGLALQSATPYPDRREFAAYCEAYARKFGLAIEFECEVTALRREGALWQVETTHGASLVRHVVVATGFYARERAHLWPGQERFGGRWLRLGDAESGGEIAGRRVLVVGLGNTAADMIAQLTRRGARVSVAVRGPVHVVPLEIARVNCFRWKQWLPERCVAVAGRFGSRAAALAGEVSASFWFALQERLYGDLRGLGIGLKGRDGIAADHASGFAPLIGGAWVGLLRRGEVDVRPGIAGFTEAGVEFEDGSHDEFDAVLPAIGMDECRFGLAGELPSPLRDGPIADRPGLWICGASPALRHIRRSAERVAAALAHAARREGEPL